MVSLSNPFPNGALDGQGIARIVGLTCVVGFLVDTTALTFPLGSGAGWRIGLLQQVGDRSIVLLIGLALLLYSFWQNRSIRKPLAYVTLTAGVIFLLFGGLVIRDSLVVRAQTLENINTQVTQLQTQIEQNRNNPEVTANVTPEQIEEATRQVSVRAETLKQNARTSITKAGLVSFGNFAVVGLALLSLGKVGMGTGNRVATAPAPRKQRRRTNLRTPN